MDLSANTLLASIFVSSIGMGFFIYGKKQARLPQFLVGIAMLASSYLVPGATEMCSVGAALVLALIVAIRMGM